MARRPCIDCGTLCTGTRCPTHQRQVQRRDTTRRAQRGIGRDTAERRRRQTAVVAHLARYGPWCPGWGRRPAHWCRPADLTADHITPRALGGETGPLTVRCRSCNSARGAKPQAS